MIGITVFGLIFTPAFYVISRMLGDWVSRRVTRRPAPPALPAPAE